VRTLLLDIARGNVQMNRIRRFLEQPAVPSGRWRRCGLGEFGMGSEVEARVVPKYRIFAETIESCPMFMSVDIQVYEITGCIGRYQRQYQFTTTRRQIEDLAKDLEGAVVEIPEGVKDLSEGEEFEEA